MNFYPIDLLLADDDKDDCLLFKEALEELPIATNLTTVNDGEQLMRLLATTTRLPDVLYLDLNMPRKNGFECLAEIKLDKKLKNLPVIIYSTSFDLQVIDLLYSKGAQYYIRKPAEFSKLKQIIHDALILTTQKIALQPRKERFILQS